MTDFLRKVDAVEMGPDEIFRKVMKGHAGLAEVDTLKACTQHHMPKFRIG